MPEITLESLAARLASLEQRVAEQTDAAGRKKDWRRAVGKFDDDPDFLRDVIEEGAAIRQADRDAAKQEIPE